MANDEALSKSVDSLGQVKRVRSSKTERRSKLVGFIIAASLALAACGGPSTSGVAGVGTTTTTTAARGGGGTVVTDALPFSRCMRRNGVANFPDPTSGGGVPKVLLQQLGVSASAFASAENACHHLLPNSGNGESQAQINYVRALSLKFAQCMRAHGVPLPDPDSSGKIPDPASVGISQGSPKFLAGNQACGKYRPPYMPSNAQYYAYVRSQG